MVEPCCKKRRKEEGKRSGEGKTPPGFNKRFPGGGFAARMKAAEKRWELLKIEKSEGRNAASHQKGKKVAKVRCETKKTILFGNFSQTSDPHPPLMGTPYPKATTLSILE